jgi:uncharacterized lipoprotein YbaY
MKKLLLTGFYLTASMMLIGCTNNQEQKTEGSQNPHEEITQNTQEPEETKIDYLVLVNKQHALPEDWEANIELIDTQNAFDETIKVEKEAYEQYLELRDELLMD